MGTKHKTDAPASNLDPLSPIAQAAFDRLVRFGCDANVLKGLLNTGAVGVRTPHATRDELSILERDLGTILVKITAFQKTFEGYSLFLISGTRAAELRRLPALLHEFREEIQQRLEQPKLAGTEGRNAVWAFVIAYVISATGHPHDADVAKVLSLGGSEPSADAIKMFRKDHRALVDVHKVISQTSFLQTGKPTG